MVVSFLKKYYWECLVAAIGLGVGIYAYYPSIVNHYVVADDLRITSYWVEQFRDHELFSNDLLTDYAKFHEPWGFYMLYYFVPWIMDPILFGNILTVILLAVCAVYLYKLGKELNGTFAGLITSVTFLVTPLYVGRMAGGMPRSFGYPLLIMFLYYFIKKEYFPTIVILILQCLYYPMIFLISIITYALAFLKFDWKSKKFIDLSSAKLKSFVIAVVACGILLAAKYIFVQNPYFAKPVTLKEMINQPEYYTGVGRWYLLPIEPVIGVVEENVVYSNNIYTAFMQQAAKIHWGTLPFKARGILFIALVYLLIEVMRKKVKFPREFVLIMISSIFLYELAVYLLLKLYWPSKYLRYSASLIGLLVFTSVIAAVINYLRPKWLKLLVQAGVLALLLFHLSFDYGKYFINETQNRPLYDYLSTLPKSALIAAHPEVADNIPLFSKRKVLVSYETSNPLYKKYWDEIKERTYNFFNAYYSDNPAVVYVFLEKYNIDYLVVKKEHFTEGYVNTGNFYFYPFNAFVKHVTQQKKGFVLKNFPDQLKRFENDQFYVIQRDDLLYFLSLINQHT